MNAIVDGPMSSSVDALWANPSRTVSTPSITTLTPLSMPVTESSLCANDQALRSDTLSESGSTTTILTSGALDAIELAAGALPFRKPIPSPFISQTQTIPITSVPDPVGPTSDPASPTSDLTSLLTDVASSTAELASPITPPAHSSLPSMAPFKHHSGVPIAAIVGCVLGITTITLALLGVYLYRRKSRRRVHVGEKAANPFLNEGSTDADPESRMDEGSEASSVFIVASSMGATVAISPVHDSTVDRIGDEEHAHHGANKEAVYPASGQPGVRTPSRRNMVTSASDLSEAPPSYHTRESAEYVLDIGGNNMGGGSRAEYFP